MPLKIIITGPECSGKTTLVNEICSETDFVAVSEMARQYLNDRNNSYDEISLLEIGLLQHKEESIKEVKHQNICCDTDLLTILIWQIEKFNNANHYLLEKWKTSKT